MKTFLFTLFLFCFTLSFSTDISGVINKYSKGIALGDCNNTIKISNPENFTIGDYVIIIQMQGAIISETDDANFGTITNINGTGLYEKATVAAVSNDTLILINELVNTYDFTKKVQVISFPLFNGVTVTSKLTCDPWDGETGGVLAFQVLGVTTMNAEMDVSGKGFRGGAALENPGENCSWLLESPSYFYPNSSWESASKGEGLSEIITGKEFGKGAQANGGGGGNDHNSGGGGGGNFGVGGLGGENNDPGLFNCKGYHPGLGGKALDYTTNLAFMGGGGGAGNGNNNLSGPGSNGGGIIIFSSTVIEGSKKEFYAKGDDAIINFGGDGSGGGGAGGTVLLNINNYGSNVVVDVAGGAGGNVNEEAYARCHGPGGGGAGGFVRSSSALTNVAVSLSGGAPGVVTNSTAACNGTSVFATKGGDGGRNTTLTIPFGTEAGGCLVTKLQFAKGNLFKIFPNPSREDFTLEFNSFAIEKIQIIDQSGRVVEQYDYPSNSIGNTLNSGIYFVLAYGKNEAQVTRIVKLK